ncbi:MAG TPA: c-type cytochrome [Casimicrobiaceae bacterium]|nr:c-type cytochrome [Casimicrobiaceae bacterium]
MKRMLVLALVFGLLGIVGAAEGAGDAAAGKTKAASCAGCHGANGEGVNQTPKLAGRPEAEFIQALQDYKSGKRPNAVMKTFAAKLSDQDMANLAAYYAALK